MKMSRFVQLFSVTAIAVVVMSTRGEAATNAVEACTQCIQGLGSICPSEADQANFCEETPCGGALPACIGNWGNCQDGYRITCNEWM